VIELVERNFRIAGARGAVGSVKAFLGKVVDYGQANNLEMEFFDAGMILGREHLVSAAEHASRAFEEGTNAARNFTTEVAMYAAGERQISKALEKVGVKDHTTELAMLLVGPGDPNRILAALGLAHDDSVLEPSHEKLLAWGFTEGELASVPVEERYALVLERVAMLDIEK